MIAAALPSEAELRAEARRALEPLCRGRCDVIDVDLKTRPARLQARVEPGFDTRPAPTRLEVEEVRLTVLFDRALGESFRAFAISRLEARVGEIASPVRVTPQVRPFPVPAEPLVSPPPETAPASPAAPIVIQTPSPPPQASRLPSPPADWSELAMRRALEVTPFLLLFALLAWLVLRVLRRLEDLAFDLRAESAAASSGSALPLPEVSATRQRLPPPTVEDVERHLSAHRSSARRVFRRLLLAGEHEVVARAVALLGEGVVKDLAHDPEVRPALRAAGARTAEVLRGPMTDEERDEMLRRVQADMVADRVAYRADDVRPELEPLLGWSPEAFVGFVSELDDHRLTHVLLRHAPGHLVEGFLLGLDPELRTELVRDVVEAPPAHPDEVAALAARVREEADSAEVGGWEADHLVDLLDALPTSAQDELLDRLERDRPDFVRRNAKSLPLESALLKVPLEALEEAWAVVSLASWVAYLRSAPADIRERLLESCPPRARPAVEDELSLRVTADLVDARMARKEVVRTALAAASRAPAPHALGPGAPASVDPHGGV